MTSRTEQIRQDCDALVGAIKRNEPEAAAAIGVRLLSGALCDLARIADACERIRLPDGR